MDKGSVHFVIQSDAHKISQACNHGRGCLFSVAQDFHVDAFQSIIQKMGARSGQIKAVFLPDIYLFRSYLLYVYVVFVLELIAIFNGLFILIFHLVRSIIGVIFYSVYVLDQPGQRPGEKTGKNQRKKSGQHQSC